MAHLTATNMDNVNNLNGVPNFGHGLADSIEGPAEEAEEIEETLEEEEPKMVKIKKGGKDK